MSDFTLTELQYSNDRQGPWKLYIFDVIEGDESYHRGGQWFRRPPLKYPDEEITANEAMYRTMEAFAAGYEVRICDGGDMLIYHAKDKKVLYPQPIGNFWNEITNG